MGWLPWIWKHPFFIVGRGKHVWKVSGKSNFWNSHTMYDITLKALWAYFYVFLSSTLTWKFRNTSFKFLYGSHNIIQTKVWAEFVNIYLRPFRSARACLWLDGLSFLRKSYNKQMNILEVEVFRTKERMEDYSRVLGLYTALKYDCWPLVPGGGGGGREFPYKRGGGPRRKIWKWPLKGTWIVKLWAW